MTKPTFDTTGASGASDAADAAGGKKAAALLLRAVLAGFSIALGGAAFLSIENRALGTLCFTVGLFIIVTNGFALYTGRVCRLFDEKPSYLIGLFITWIGNYLGAGGAAALLSLTRIGEKLRGGAAALCEIKLSDGLLSVFLLAVFCNVLIYIAVDGFRENPHEPGKYLALFFGVCVFIFCGYEHCVANMFYFSMAGIFSAKSFGYLLIMTAGNSVGGLLIPLLKKIAARLER